jgi:ribose 1,5-bisphosphate isomerase
MWRRTSLPKAVRKIKSVEIQGAKEIAVYSLKFLRRLCKKKGFGKEFRRAAKELEKARPTAVVLHNCLEIIRKEKSIDSIDGLLKRLENFNKQIAANGLKVFKKKRYTILTHCHSDEALAVIKKLKRKGKKIQVIATETDPLEQGVKTAKELARARVPVTLIVDSAVGYFMPDIDAVVVGTDAIRKEGIVNKIGTKLYAIAAKQHKKPFYVVGNTLKLDKRKDFKIEQRPEKEVYKELMKPGRLKRVKIENPAFDITPWEFVSRVINERGIYTPAQIKRMMK